MQYINFLLYLVLLLYLWKKKKSNLALYISAIWTVSAFLGIFYVESVVYRIGNYSVSLAPFIYLFVCFTVALIPFIKQNNKITQIVHGNQFVDVLSTFLCIIGIWPFLEGCYRIGELIISGQFLMLGANYDDFASGKADALIEFTQIGEYGIYIISWFKILIPILFFYYIQHHKHKKWLPFGLFISALIPSLSNIAYGSKTQIIFFLLYFVGLYLYLRNTFTKELNRKMQIIIGTMASIVVVATISLAIGRYVIGSRYINSGIGSIDYLFQYSAESMYNFNENAYHETRPLYGYETMLPVMIQLGITKIDSEDRRLYINNHIKSPAHIFYNYFGDIYLDWGPILTFIFVAGWSLYFFLLHTKKVKNKMSLTNLTILSIYIYLMCNSLFYFSLKMSWTPIYINVAFAITVALLNQNRKRSNGTPARRY